TNSRPVASAGLDQTVIPGKTVRLDGSGSSDADHDPLTFRWSIISRPAGSTAALSNVSAVSRAFVADAPGLYVVQLITNDGKIDSAPHTVTITAADAAVMSCGDVRSGNITVSGQVDHISFNGQTNQKIALTLGASGFPTFVTATATVFSPTGVLVGTFNA